MALQFHHGDVAACDRTLDGPVVLVHVVNDVGIWGSGVVVAIGRRWPHAEAAYRAWHAGRINVKTFQLGAVGYVPCGQVTVAHLVGQHGIARPGRPPPIRYRALAVGLADVAATARRLGAAVACPRLGAGRAGGDWHRIAGLLEDTVVDAGVDVHVFDHPG